MPSPFTRLCCRAALLFALHPVHTEAVTGVVGRAELLSAIMCLLALLLYMSAVDGTASLHVSRHSLLLLAALTCAAAAMAAKETGFTILGAFVLYDMLVLALPSAPPPLAAGRANVASSSACHAASSSATPPPAPPLTPKQALNGKKTMALHAARGATTSDASTLAKDATRQYVFRCTFRVCATFALAAAYLAARRAIMGGDTLVHIYRKVENPLAFYPTRSQRLLSTFHQHWCYFYLLLVPLHLSADWSFSCVPPVESLADPRNFGTAVLYLCAAVLVLAAAPWRLRRLERLRASRVRAFILLALMVAPFVPSMNVRTLLR